MSKLLCDLLLMHSLKVFLHFRLTAEEDLKVDVLCFYLIMLRCIDAEYFMLAGRGIQPCLCQHVNRPKIRWKRAHNHWGTTAVLEKGQLAE